MDSIVARTTPPIKLKNEKPRIIFNLRETFGFQPNILIIDKVGKTNKFTVSAIIPKNYKEFREPKTEIIV